MKVILLRDVAKIGKRFSVVEVPDGYALNKLIPQKDAEAASPANLRKVLQKQKNDSAHQATTTAAAEAVAKATAEEPLQIVMEANENGHLFQAVHTQAIVKAAAERKLFISAESLVVPTPIKELGTHTVTLQVEGTAVTIQIEVSAKKK